MTSVTMAEPAVPSAGTSQEKHHFRELERNVERIFILNMLTFNVFPDIGINESVRFRNVSLEFGRKVVRDRVGMSIYRVAGVSNSFSLGATSASRLPSKGQI